MVSNTGSWCACSRDRRCASHLLRRCRALMAILWADGLSSRLFRVEVTSVPLLRHQTRKFRLRDGTSCLFLMARRHRVVCLYALVVIPPSSATGQLFLVSTPLAYELTYRLQVSLRTHILSIFSWILFLFLDESSHRGHPSDYSPNRTLPYLQVGLFSLYNCH